MAPLLAEVEALNQRIAAYDQQIEQLAKEHYPEVVRLKQVKGVGTLIALTFALTVDDPNRLKWGQVQTCLEYTHSSDATSGKPADKDLILVA